MEARRQSAQTVTQNTTARDRLCGDSHLNVHILSWLDVPTVGRVAQVNQALSQQTLEPSLWTILYDRRWRSRLIVAGGPPTRADYLQRFRAHSKAHAPPRKYDDEQYIIHLEVTTTGGKPVFDGSVTVHLKDGDPLPELTIQNTIRSSLLCPPPTEPLSWSAELDEALDEFGVRKHSLSWLRANMLVVRGSDQAMAAVWSDQLMCFADECLPIWLCRYVPTSYAEEDRRFLIFGEDDCEIDNYDEVQHPAVAHAYHGVLADGESFGPYGPSTSSLMIPAIVYLDQAADSGSTCKVTPTIHCSGNDGPTTESIATAHDLLDAMTHASFNWQTQ